MCCNLLSEGHVFICVIQPSLFMVVSGILLGFSAASAEFTYTTLILIIWKYYVLFLSLYTQHTYRIFSNLIRTSFANFLHEKKLVRGSNLYLSFNRPLPTRQTD